MARRFLLYSFFLSAWLASCNEAGEEYNSEQQTIRFVELSHGIATQNSSQYDDDESSDNFAVADETDTIPAKLGARFGIRYMLESNLDPVVSLRQVWVFPDSMHDEEGNVYKQESYVINRLPNQEKYAAYKLEYPYEIIKGKWQLCFYYKKHLLYRKIFVLI